jgi:hypothetical protein
LALFNFTNGSLSRAIGLSIILFSIMGLIVDLTSEQNATAYYTNCTLKCRMAISEFIMVNADTTTKEYAE